MKIGTNVGRLTNQENNKNKGKYTCREKQDDEDNRPGTGNVGVLWVEASPRGEDNRVDAKPYMVSVLGFDALATFVATP